MRLFQKIKINDNIIRLDYVIVLIVLIVISTSCAILRKQNSNYTENILKINIEMIELKGGSFKMGCNEKKRDCKEDELPAHNVFLKDFFIGKYEITFEQYDIFCQNTGRKKPYDNGWGRGNLPVINVSWYDATEFCKWLSKKSGQKYSLPTEAEWEYAAKGGVKSKGFLYSGSNTAYKVAWFSPDTSMQPKNITHRKRTQLVGNKQANELDIFDMSGNVWEWCIDGYDKDFYKNSSITNPKGNGIACVARGGSWYNNEKYCEITNRDYDARDVKDNDLGFRIVRSIE